MGCEPDPLRPLGNHGIARESLRLIDKCAAARMGRHMTKRERAACAAEHRRPERTPGSDSFCAHENT